MPKAPPIRFKTEELIDCSCGGLPSNANELIIWLQEFIEKVPYDCRNSVRVEFNDENDYGYVYTKIRLTYVRPETKEETELRVKEEIKFHEDNAKRELAQLEQLKNKYEKNGTK